MSKKPNRATRKDGSFDWKKQHAFDLSFAKKVLLQQGQLVSMFDLHFADKDIVLVTPFTSDAFKQACLDLISVWVVAEGAMGLTSISEVWFRELRRLPGETPDEITKRSYDGPRPSQAEDRKESIMVHTMFRDGAGQRQLLTTCCEIIRGNDGKPTGFAAPMTHKTDMSGAFVDLFPEWPPNSNRIEMAKAILPLAKARLDMMHVEPQT